MPIDVDQERALTMVTLITEKLQNQSLDDLTRRAREAGPVSQLGGQSGHSPLCGDSILRVETELSGGAGQKPVSV